MRLGTVRADGSILLHDENIKFRDAMSGRFQRVRQTTKQRMFLTDNGFTPTNSSFISGVGVNDKDLYIRFINSSVYVYYGFANHFDDMLLANSKGQYFNRKIRATTRYEKIDSLPYPAGTEASPLELLDDKDLFEAFDYDYIAKLARNMVGADLFVKDIIMNGIDFTQFTINDLVILRPKISRL